MAFAIPEPWRARLSIGLVGLCGVSFSGNAEENIVRELRRFPDPPRGGGESAGPLFESVPAEESGVDFVIPIDTGHPDDRLYYSAMACGGVAAGDLDGDGWPDLFFSAGPVANRLFRNRGEGAPMSFEEVSAEAGVADPDLWSTGAAMADVDDDGDLDLYVCVYDQPNRLYLNESSPGRIRFREAASAWGLDIVDASLMPTFADYDRDGDLDLFVVANGLYRKGGRPKEGVPLQKTAEGWKMLPPWDRYYRVSSIDQATGEPKYDECGRPNRLLRNDGDRFEDVSVDSGLLMTPSHSNAAAWWDFDGDGWLDLYVANDFSDRDECYRNLGNGRFVEVAPDLFQHTTWFSMGAAADDFNGDGRTDLVVADMAPTTHYREKVTMGEMGATFEAMYAAGLPRQKMANTFFVNTGANLFLEAGRHAGIAKTDWTWTVKSGDLDSDGRIDLYFTTGHTRDFNHSDFAQASMSQRIGKDDWETFEDLPELRERDLAFRNGSDWKFEGAGEAWGLGLESTMTYGAALSDLDRDGDLDLVTVRLEDPPGVFQNRAAEQSGAGRLLVSLRGKQSNRHGIGAKITAITDQGTRLTRTLLPQNGYQESDEPVVHFGLGAADSVASLTIEWPGGTRQVLFDLPGNRWLEIAEAENEPADGKGKEEADDEALPSRFRASSVLASMAVPEIPFDDFARQPLLPHRHSQLGPGMAIADVDGDGRDDLYLGGPRGGIGRLLLHRGIDPQGEPVFAFRRKAPFTQMAEFEDLGALLFEADGDGDRDLLVVSGSVECEPGDPSLRDRLYRNEGGKGEFVEAAGALPEPSEGVSASGSVATAADFDRDGDLDVFIGGRIVPGKYPLAARNRLLVNNGEGRFVDEAETQGVEETGLVTAALWTDVDGDGWLDLMVAHEWGPVRLFANREGALEERTEAAGLLEASGFWNSLAGRDLDGDGDLDYVAGNLGHNTKYRASHESPEILYYGRFGNDERRNLIEAKADKEQDQLLPRRGLSCSRRAIPGLRSQVGTFHQWASSSLGELYSVTRLDEASKWEVTTLDSVMWINDGEGRFEARPLPPMAQLAPVFGIALTDVDSDGRCDAILAQNFFGPQEETGPYDGSLSLLLTGRESENGQFEWAERWPLESGIAVPGDAKSLGVGDFDANGRPDLVFGVNNSAPVLFLNDSEHREGSSAGIPLGVRLVGDRGNPDAVGARIRVEIPDRPIQVAEISAGSGYLTQNASRLHFGWGPASSLRKDVRAELTIHWPDGTQTRHFVAPSDGPVVTLRKNAE